MTNLAAAQKWARLAGPVKIEKKCTARCEASDKAPSSTFAQFGKVTQSLTEFPSALSPYLQIKIKPSGAIRAPRPPRRALNAVLRAPADCDVA
ncbi:hypothetical protein EVAR_40199_1 [Eumeta japonica]|uniref:Uncharacterized protein n=1 Tax=Eumeta variegata TaxID=151549 RepID=A0A4C1XKI5_EUMVA|nr:hypothetical protein EVAR_40199_1 [Eumeta japonica]